MLAHAFHGGGVSATVQGFSSRRHGEYPCTPLVSSGTSLCAKDTIDAFVCLR